MSHSNPIHRVLTHKRLGAAAPRGLCMDYLLWLATWRCNLSCIHCYTSRFKGCEEMPKQRVFSMIEEMADAGIEHLAITGGEPLVRQDIFEIIEHAHRVGVNTSLTTNATLLTRKAINTLKRFDVYVYVGVDGGTKEVHERIRGAGAWERLNKSLKALRAAGISFSTIFTITSENYHDVGNYVAFAAERGAVETLMIPVVPAGRADRKLVPTPKQLLEAVRIAEERCREGGYWTTVMCSPALKSVELSRVFVGSCRFSRSLDVDPSGNVLLCDTLDLVMTNLREKSVGEAAEEYLNHPLVIRLDRGELPKECESCQFASFCRGGCRARSLLMRGSLDVADPLCPMRLEVLSE